MSQDESPDNSPSGLNIDEDHVSEGEGHSAMMDSSPRFEENETTAKVSPTSEAVANPDVGSTAVSDTGSAAVPDMDSTAAPGMESTAAPDTESTAAPDTESTAAPDTESTAAPDTGSSAAPDTGTTAVPGTEATELSGTESTELPDAGSSATPDTDSTELPGTGSSAVPDTGTTAEILPVEPSSDASNSDGNANANVLEETNEMEIDNIDDAVAKEPEKISESYEQNGTEGKDLCDEISPSSPPSMAEPCETAESENVTCHSDAPASPTDDSEQAVDPVTVSLDSEITQESSNNVDLNADVSLSSALEEESNASYEASINTEEAQNVDDDDKDDDNHMDTNQSNTGNDKKTKSQVAKAAAAPADDEEAIDLEDGELPESDEEEDQAPKSKDKTASEVVAELQAKAKSSSIEKDKSSKEKQKEKEKEREKRKKEKDEKKREKEKKKRRHSDDENKSSKSKRKKEEEANAGGNEGDYFYAHGPSPDNPSFGNGEDVDARPDQNEGEEFERRNRDHRGRRREERPAPPANRGRSQPDNARKNESKPPKTDLICLYFMQGKCQKSADDCNFSHDATPPRKMELCKFWMMECCAKKEKCLYLHNDFPCKFYHTGLICKLGEKCKFSHQPLNEQTKAVLLKHIETAPKEILGDFPRLNRAGALNLINKMENKINMQMNGGGDRDREYRDDSGPNHQKFGHHNNSPHSHSSMDSHQDRNQNRRTRWEQPTRDDQEKLHELMEEAGIGNLYKEATEPENELPQKPPSQPILPTPTPLLANPALSNPALGNVLASLNIPTNALSASQNPVNPFVPDPQFFHSLQILSAATGGPNGPTPQQIHQATQAIQQQLQNFQQSQQLQQQVTLPTSVVVPPSSTIGTSLPNPSMTSSSQIANDDMMSPPSPNKPTLETLPKMQREIFKRIQNMQKKKEQGNSGGGESEIRMDDDWYSSEDEDQDKSPIRQSSASNQRKIPQNTVPCVPTATPTPMPLKDVDLRSMPFGDTDFRLPPLRSGTSFQDIDLRTGDSSGFKKIPETPATEIDAGISTHSGITWKVVEVAGIRRIDYSYVRGSVQSNQILSDPRLASLRSGGSSVPIGPESPPPSSAMDSPNIFGMSSPARDFSDPRTRKNQRDTGGGRSSLGAPDGPPQQQQQPLLQTPQLNPPFFAPTDISPAAFAQLMQSAAASNPVAASALLPNVPPGSFVTQDFMNIAAAAAQAAAVALQQQQQQAPGQQMMSRPPFHQPKSSWESRYQQGSGGVTPPL